MVKNRLILASESPRRSEMLKQMGFDFDVIPSRVEERPVPRETPQDHVIRLAEAKAADVGKQYPDRWIIAADTVVAINGSILGKPREAGEAIEMLSLLSGREHAVLTGFSVRHFEKGKTGHQAVRTSVRIKTLLPAEMKWYVRTGEPFDKAGGYAIQGLAAAFVERIEGSYSGVVGLPLFETARLLQDSGITGWQADAVRHE